MKDMGDTLEHVTLSTTTAVLLLTSMAALCVLAFSLIMCSWVWRKVRWSDGEPDEEEILRKDYAPGNSTSISTGGAAHLSSSTAGSGASTPTSGTAATLMRSSPDGEGVGAAAAATFVQRGAATMATAQERRKCFQMERPKRETIAVDHVMPSSPVRAGLHHQFSLREGTEHRMGGLIRTGSAPGTPTGHQHSSAAGSAADREERGGRRTFRRTSSTASMWQNVKDMAIKFIEDPEVVEDEATESIVDGVDYKLGRIQVGLAYDFQTLTLTLRIIRAVDLPAKDLMGTSDPYVKIQLLPDKKHKLMTKVKKRNLNPQWNECFLFEGWPHNKLLDKVVYLQVIDYDRFSKDDPIGETYIPLNEVDLSQGPISWKFLQPCKETRGKLGELLLSLCYQPSIGRLTVVVMKAKDLKAKDITGSSDPYVKVWLHYGTTRVEKKKTSIKMCTLNPVFNESFIFNVPWDRIREASLEVTVMDFDRVGRNEMIGKVTLGSRSGPMEIRHWNDMAAKPRQQVAQWHLLKD